MIDRLFTPRFTYDHALDQQRARGLQILSIVLIALIALLTLSLVLAQTGAIPATGSPLQFSPELLLVLAAMAGVLVLVLVLLRRGTLEWASWLMVGLLVVLTVAPVASYDFQVLYLVIPLLTSALLLNRRGLLVTAVIVAVALGVRYAALSELDRPIRVVPSREIGAVMFQTVPVFLLIFVLLLLFGASTVLIGRASIRAYRRLTRITGLTPQLAADTSEEALMSRVLLAGRESLGYVLTQLYIIDVNGRVLRRVRQGLGPGAIIASTNTNPGEWAVMADVSQSRQPVSVTAADGAPRSQHLVAPARRSISVPVIFPDGRVTAMLDVQSVSAREPAEGDIQALITLAQTFALAWERLALTQDQARVLTEQTQQIERLREQVGVLEGRSRQTALSGWESYLRGRGEERIGFDLVRQQNGLSERDLRPASDLPPELRAALEHGEPLLTEENGEQIVHVPIRVREAMLGAMAFRVPAGQPVSQRQMETVQVVAERLGLALESTRLYEQYQSQARRERKASEVTSVLLGATDLNALLNAAAGAFNEALGAVYTRVTIEPEAIAQPAARPEAANGHRQPASQGGN